jgi:hypothetical protein
MHLRSSLLSRFGAAIAATLALALAPAFAYAAKAESCSVDDLDGLVESTLEATSTRPTIRGEVSGTRTVQVVVRKEGTDKALYQSKIVRVRGDEWSLKIPKKLKDGEYEVEVYCPKVKRGEAIAEGELVIDSDAPAAKAKKADTTLAVSGIPLLSGGSAEGGDTVPVAYLKIANVGKVDVEIDGFTVRQNGTASAKSVIGFEVVDGTGTARVTTEGDEGDQPFKDSVALARADVVIPAGGFKLFTIKAILADELGSAVGKSLKIDVTGATSDGKVAGKFPIKGTTWTLR